MSDDGGSNVTSLRVNEDILKLNSFQKEKGVNHFGTDKKGNHVT